FAALFVGLAYPLLDLRAIRRIHPAHAVPVLSQPVVIRREVRLAFGVFGCSANVQIKVKLFIEHLEELSRRRPIVALGREVNIAWPSDIDQPPKKIAVREAGSWQWDVFENEVRPPASLWLRGQELNLLISGLWTRRATVAPSSPWWKLRPSIQRERSKTAEKL